MITRHFALRYIDHNGQERYSQFSELASNKIFKREVKLRDYDYKRLFREFREYYFIGMPGLPEDFDFDRDTDLEIDHSTLTYDQLVNVLVINYAESIEGQTDDDITVYWS